MNMFPVYIGLLGLILLFGVALNRFAQFMKMPILICFLGVGILCGPYGLELFPSFSLEQIKRFGEIALCFIIFSGGLQTSFASIRSVFRTGTILASAGVILTAVFCGLAGFACGHFPFLQTLTLTQAFLFGAIFSSTDAAAVFAILRGQKAKIEPRLQSLLEYESGSNDPAAFLLTTVVIDMLLREDSVTIMGASFDVGIGIIWGLGMGIAIGFLIGVFGQWFYNWIQYFLEYNGLRLVVAVAIVLLAFGLANAVFNANSLMTCYVAGITMGNLRYNFKRIFIKFHDGLSWLMQILLFTILGSCFDYRMFFDFEVMISAIFVVVILAFFARPIAVLLCMIRSPFSLKERIFVSWVGIRGSAPIMLAILVCAAVVENSTDDARVQSAQYFFYMVFIVVLMTILFQGSSLIWVARKLGLVLPYEEKEEQLLEYDERADGREIYQFTIEADNQLNGTRLGNAGLGGMDTVLLMIKRGEDILQPKPDIVLQAGDALNFLGDREAMQMLHEQFFPNEDYSSPMPWSQAVTSIVESFKKTLHINKE